MCVCMYVIKWDHRLSICYISLKKQLCCFTEQHPGLKIKDQVKRLSGNHRVLLKQFPEKYLQYLSMVLLLVFFLWVNSARRVSHWRFNIQKRWVCMIIVNSLYSMQLPEIRTPNLVRTLVSGHYKAWIVLIRVFW